jgi:hypothetical protein
MVTFYLFMAPKDIVILKNIKLRQAQNIFNDILEHYNRTRDEGLHLLHFENYFKTSVEMIIMTLQMNTTTLEWNLLDIAREKFEKERSNAAKQNSKPDLPLKLKKKKGKAK